MFHTSKQFKMRIIHWNISYGSDSAKIASIVTEELEKGDTIICLQEVTTAAFDKILPSGFRPNSYAYSLEYRKPGKYDGKNRGLGVLIICSKNIHIIDSCVLNRTPFPDRTMYVEVLYYGKVIKIMSLHSITGCDYSKAKPAQFLSFAEAIETYKPDIVTMDANEPRIDHYDVNQIQFYDNKDKGNGAKTFFMTMSKSGLVDSYAHFFNAEDYVEGNPLTPSIDVNKKGFCRYDFIFVNDTRLPLKSCEYQYRRGVELTSDHAIIVVDVEFRNRSARPDEGIDNNCAIPFDRFTEDRLIKYCRYYGHPEREGNPCIADYERKWVEDILNKKGNPLDYVELDDLCWLETFSMNDGVPLGIKAILYNRYWHWSSYNTLDDFIHWYFNTYLK